MIINFHRVLINAIVIVAVLCFEESFINSIQVDSTSILSEQQTDQYQQKEHQYPRYPVSFLLETERESEEEEDNKSKKYKESATLTTRTFQKVYLCKKGTEKVLLPPVSSRFTGRYLFLEYKVFLI